MHWQIQEMPLPFQETNTIFYRKYTEVQRFTGIVTILLVFGIDH